MDIPHTEASLLWDRKNAIASPQNMAIKDPDVGRFLLVAVFDV